MNNLLTINDLWARLMDNVEDKVFPHLRYHSIVVKELAHLFTDEHNTSTNILLYGAPGFPMNVLWEAVFMRTHNICARTMKRMLCWNNQVTYTETPYFFEIDFAYPHNSKDTDTLAAFIKELISHQCVFNKRHIIVLNNIDYICCAQSQYGKQSYAFRVLLERFSHNALFICTTNNRSGIEQPLISRFLGFRVPLATTEELQNIFRALDLPFHPFMLQYSCRDMYLAMYVAWLSMYAPQHITHDMFKYKVANFHQLVATNLKSRQKISHEELREITSKISVHDASIRDIAMDLAQDAKTDQQKSSIMECAAQIDHMCSTTESFRKPLYIELFLNSVVLNNGKIIAKNV